MHAKSRTVIPALAGVNDAKGDDRVFSGGANGSVGFELAQLSVRPGTVPISIVMYIDATYIKHGIPIRPIYSEFRLSLLFPIYDIIV